MVGQPDPGSNDALAGSAPGMIRIELTGPLRRAAGTDSVVVLTDSPITLEELLNRLRNLYPATLPHLPPGTDASGRCRALPPGLLVLRNQQLLPAQTASLVSAGEQITLMPMISGG